MLQFSDPSFFFDRLSHCCAAFEAYQLHVQMAVTLWGTITAQGGMKNVTRTHAIHWYMLAFSTHTWIYYSKLQYLPVPTFMPVYIYIIITHWITLTIFTSKRIIIHRFEFSKNRWNIYIYIYIIVKHFKFKLTQNPLIEQNVFSWSFSWLETPGVREKVKKQLLAQGIWGQLERVPGFQQAAPGRWNAWDMQNHLWLVIVLKTLKIYNKQLHMMSNYLQCNYLIAVKYLLQLSSSL